MKTGLRAIMCSALAVLGLLPATSTRCMAATPFDSYVRAAPEVFVTDKSLFSPYAGANVSNWIPPEEKENTAEGRRRLGLFTLAPGQQVYIDVVQTGLPTYYELRYAGNGRLIHRFEYAEGWDEGALLLLNGHGSVYEYARPRDLCLGMATKKFEFRGGALIEVKQPFVYLDDSDTTTLEEIPLFQDTRSASPQVATLNKGSQVKILDSRKIGDAHWYLIKTPLGLTGWVPLTLPGSQQPTLDKLICG